MSSNLPLVSVLTLLPFLGGIAVLLLGRAGRGAARLTAMAFCYRGGYLYGGPLVRVSTFCARDATAGTAPLGA